MLNNAVSSLQREKLSTLRRAPRALVLAWLEVPETLCATCRVVSPLLPALSWTHIEVGEPDPFAPPPQAQSYGRIRYTESSGMEGVSPCFSKEEALLWGKILLSHHLSFPATGPTSWSTGGFTNKHESKAGLRHGRESQPGPAWGFGAGKAPSLPIPPLQPRRDDVGQGRGLLFLHQKQSITSQSQGSQATRSQPKKLCFLWVKWG